MKPLPEPPELAQPMVDDIVVELQKLATEYHVQKKPTDLIDACTNWAYIVSDKLPMCCAGHRVDRLASIQQEMHMSVNVCKQFGCEDKEMHSFINSLVRIIGEAGQRLMLNRMLEERRN